MGRSEHLYTVVDDRDRRISFAVHETISELLLALGLAD